MSFFTHNSSFLGFQCIYVSTRLNHNFDPRWLRTKKIIQHSYYLGHFECPMWISFNLKMVEFRTNLLPKLGFRVDEFKRIQIAFKLLWPKPKAMKDHILRLFSDLDVVLHAQFEVHCITSHFSFNSVKPQFWSKMTQDQENNTTFLLSRPFRVSHVNFVQFGSILNSFNFVRSKSWSWEQVRTKFNHLQIVRNSHGTLKMVLIIEMLNYFLGPESSRIKIVV